MRIPILLALAVCLPALEVVGQPDWLDRNFTANWKAKPLAEVLEQVRKEIDRPIVVSDDAQAAGTHEVIVIDARRGTMRKALLALEEASGIRLTAEPLRLVVRTAIEDRDRRRRVVDIDLRRWGAGIDATDMWGPDLGMSRDEGGASVTPSGAMQEELEGLAGLADDEKSGLKGALRGDGAMRIAATPEEEKVVRERLTAYLGLITRSQGWIVTAGLAAADAQIPAGLVRADQAHALAASLRDRRETRIRGWAGQRVYAVAGGERSFSSDADVVGGQLDPVVELLRTGRSVEVQAFAGQAGTMLEWSVQWVDPLPSQERQALSPPQRGEELATLSTDEKGKSETKVVQEPRKPGSAVKIELPAVWSWRQSGEVLLPAGMAVVAITSHPDGRAVLVLENQP